MRAGTLDIRLAQMEDRLLVHEVRHDSDQKKLVEEAGMANMWRRKADCGVGAEVCGLEEGDVEVGKGGQDGHNTFQTQ